jgi:hypothetical protein
MPTSKKTASQAGKDLRDPRTPKRDRGPIASDLAQAKKKKLQPSGAKIAPFLLDSSRHIWILNARGKPRPVFST